MEDETVNQQSLIERAIFYFKRKKIFFLIIFILITFTVIGIVILNYYKDSQNEKISEKYIKAGIYLSSENKEASKKIYKEIVLSKNKFYSLLALNNIVENELEKNSEEILKLFEVVESIKSQKEQINLLKIKKSLYLMKIEKNEEAKKILNEIIESDSIWKETALEILK